MWKKRDINPGLGVRPVRKSKAMVIIAVTLTIIAVAAPLALAEIYNWTQVNSADRAAYFAPFQEELLILCFNCGDVKRSRAAKPLRIGDWESRWLMIPKKR